MPVVVFEHRLIVVHHVIDEGIGPLIAAMKAAWGLVGFNLRRYPAPPLNRARNPAHRPDPEAQNAKFRKIYLNRSLRQASASIRKPGKRFHTVSDLSGLWKVPASRAAHDARPTFGLDGPALRERLNFRRRRAASTGRCC